MGIFTAQRTIPEVSSFFQPLEDAIRFKLVPALLGKCVNDIERDIIALPTRLGGLGIHDPTKTADREYKCSREITKQLVNLILNQQPSLDEINNIQIHKIKQDLKNEKVKILQEQCDTIKQQLSPKSKKCLLLAAEKGASSWLTALPLQELKYSLNQQEFRNAIMVRYDWAIPDMPTFCGCGSKNNIDHALVCKKGGYPILRHNAIRDTAALIMREAGCVDVKIEPGLQDCSSDMSLHQHTNTQAGARLDVSARGIFGTFERTFCDVRVTHPNCPSNVFKPIADIYKEHEAAKKREYEERVLQTEKGSFVPVVLTTSGGMGPACKNMLKRLAQKISEKRGERYSDVINHLRTRIRFSLLRGVLVALTGERGAPSKIREEHDMHSVNFNLVLEGRSYEPR